MAKTPTKTATKETVKSSEKTPTKPPKVDEEHDDFLKLSLSTGHNPPTPTNPHQPPPPTNFHQPPLLVTTPSQPLTLFAQAVPQAPPPPLIQYHLSHLPHNPPSASHHETSGPSRPTRARRSPVQTLKQGKSEDIPAPFPWAITKRATVHNLDYLLSNGMNTINGLMQCKKCDQSYEIHYNLRQKFKEIAGYISKHKCNMHDRAPADWMNPTLPNCKFCDQNNCMKPVISKKRSINWLFLLLGQMLGCCKLSELKYFCKHTKNHRTGAKDRVLYLTYLGLCKQLDPNGPFEI
ncbi:uncharacterized protein [Pyrus communis]|uniref:uncharacterized protein n=1 Tax=Pyrus communis TaxID=23211 RepID=UPI0035BF71AE